VEFDGKELRSNHKLGKEINLKECIGTMELFA